MYDRYINKDDNNTTTGVRSTKHTPNNRRAVIEDNRPETKQLKALQESISNSISVNRPCISESKGSSKINNTAPIQRYVVVDGHVFGENQTDPRYKNWINDSIPRSYIDAKEFTDHFNKKTNYLGYVEKGKDSIWVRFEKDKTNLIGEDHSFITLQDIMTSVNFNDQYLHENYEDISIEELPSVYTMLTNNDTKYKDHILDDFTSKMCYRLLYILYQFRGKNLFDFFVAKNPCSNQLIINALSLEIAYLNDIFRENFDPIKGNNNLRIKDRYDNLETIYGKNKNDLKTLSFHLMYCNNLPDLENKIEEGDKVNYLNIIKETTVSLYYYLCEKLQIDNYETSDFSTYKWEESEKKFHKKREDVMYEKISGLKEDGKTKFIGMGKNHYDSLKDRLRKKIAKFDLTPGGADFKKFIRDKENIQKICIESTGKLKKHEDMDKFNYAIASCADTPAECEVTPRGEERKEEEEEKKEGIISYRVSDNKVSKMSKPLYHPSKKELKEKKSSSFCCTGKPKRK
jgi:hypothetical protein